MRAIRSDVREVKSVGGDGAEDRCTRSSGRGRLIDFGGVVALALSIRLICLFELREHVFFHTLISDGAAYDAWAARIAAGDWLGTGVFYQAPLYPYFLGLVQQCVGEDLARIRGAQALIGALSCGLLYLAGSRLLGRGAGLAAGILLAIYPPAVFFDLIVQKCVLDSFCLAALLWALASSQARVARRPSAMASWVGAGVALGALILARENALLLLPAIVLWILIRFRPERLWRRVQRSAALAAGAALLLGPVSLRNLLVGGEFALTTSQLGPNFFIGNNANAPGVYVPLRANRSDPLNERADATALAQEALQRELSPAEVSHYWLGRAWDFIRTQPAAWLRLIGVKTLLTVNAYEVPDAEDIYFLERSSRLLRILDATFHFGVLLPLAAAGFVFAARGRRDISILWVVILALTFGVACFYVFGRYRFTLVPPLVLLAGYACAALLGGAGARHVARSHRIEWLFALGAATAAALVSNARFTVSGGKLTPFLFGAARPVFHRDAQISVSLTNAGHVRLRQGRVDEAIELYRQAIEVEPRFAGAHFQLGVALGRADRWGEAADEFRVAARLDPDASLVQLSLGAALALLGERTPAAVHLRSGLGMTPVEPAGWNRAGMTETALGDWPSGIDHLRRAVREQPDNPAFAIDLAEALVSAPTPPTGAADEAIALLTAVVRPAALPASGVRRARDGRRFSPGEIEAWADEPRASLSLSRALRLVGRSADASAALERATALARRQNRAVQMRLAEEFARTYRALTEGGGGAGNQP